MKKKTINAVICKKFDDWVSNIDDDSVKELVKKNSIITGGCIASMLLKEKVNDFDVYFTNKETVKAVAQYYVNKFNEAHDEDGYVLDGAEIENLKQNNEQHSVAGGVGLNMTADRIKIVFQSKGVGKEEGAISDDDELEEWPDGKPVVEEETKPKYRPIYLSCNAITLSHQIQIVIRFYGDPDNIHQHYDYVHCTNYWTSKDRSVTLKQAALEALLSRELIYIGSKYPLASVIRTRKFIKRGFTINAGQYLKMAFQISQLDLTDLPTLEDQLIGVDVAYFQMLISALTEHSAKEKEAGRQFRLEYSYLASIIDKIF
jgi:hypothetical protein